MNRYEIQRLDPETGWRSYTTRSGLAQARELARWFFQNYSGFYRVVNPRTWEIVFETREGR